MKIETRRVFIESYEFYKANFRKLSVFALLAFIYDILSAVNSYFGAVHPQTSPSRVLLLLFWSTTAIFYPKFVLAKLKYINDICSDKDIGFFDAYKQSKGKYWALVRYFFLVFIPLLAFMLVMQNLPFNNVYLTLCMAIVNVPIFFVIPIISLESKTKGFIPRSIALMRGNFASILILELLSSTIYRMINAVFTALYEGDSYAILLIACGYAFTNFFVSPFANTVVFMAYKTVAGEERMQEINEVSSPQSHQQWIIIGEDANEHTILYRGMWFFGNVKLVIDGQMQEFEPIAIKKVGWLVSFAVGDKEVLLTIPFDEKNIDLATDGVFHNSGSSTSEILDLSESDTLALKGEYTALRNKVKQANGSFLLW